MNSPRRPLFSEITHIYIVNNIIDTMYMHIICTVYIFILHVLCTKIVHFMYFSDSSSFNY